MCMCVTTLMEEWGEQREKEKEEDITRDRGERLAPAKRKTHTTFVRRCRVFCVNSISRLLASVKSAAVKEREGR